MQAHYLRSRPLQQVVLVAMFNAEGAPSPYVVQGQTVNLFALKEPEDKTLPMVTLVLYELDSNGWPTGAKKGLQSQQSSLQCSGWPHPAPRSACASVQ